ncbi:MAG: hypothetical protein K2X91_00495, partial [Thermoleophilia bacterium]|nr:hypothetical protein [Thermoleophilia bacterium]
IGDGIEVVIPGIGTLGSNDITTDLGYSFFGNDISGGPVAVELIGYFPVGTSGPTPVVDTVTYTIRAADGREASATVTIIIDNTAPVATTLNLTLAPGETVLFADLVRDAGFDADGDAMFIDTFGAPSGLVTPVLDANNTFIGVRLNPLAGETTGQFEYRLQDTSGAGGNVGTGILNVTFEEPPPTPAPVYAIAVTGPASVAEGTGPTATGFFTITISRSGPDLPAALVRYSIGPGTGDGADLADLGLQNSPGPYARSFAEGETSITFTQFIAPDAAFEPDETVLFTLLDAYRDDALGSTGPTYGTIDPAAASAQVTIQNDDAAPPPPSIAFAAADAGSTPEAGGALFFTLAHSGRLDDAFTVDLRLSG